MDDLDANALTLFHHVAESLSLTQAARRIGVTRSALSHRLKAIEQRLGVQLLVRTTRRVSLTEAGRLLAQQAHKLHDTLEEAQLIAHGLNEELQGHIHIAAPPVFGREWLAPKLMRFLEAHPAITAGLELTEAELDLVNHRLDVAIRVTSTPPAEYAAKQLCDVEWLLCASPALLMTLPSELSPESLMRVPRLGFISGTQRMGMTLVRGKERVTLAGAIRFETNDLTFALDAALRGLGVAVLPDYLATRFLAAGQLRRLLPQWIVEWNFGTQAYAVHMPGRMLPARVRRLLRFLAAQRG